MFYYRVFLAGQRGLFTWCSPQSIIPGTLVTVRFRDKAFKGLLLDTVEKPDYEVKLIEKVHDLLLNQPLLVLANFLADNYYARLEKVLELMIHDSVWENTILDKNITYELNNNTENFKRLGKRQMAVLEAFENEAILSEPFLKTLAPIATIRDLTDKTLLNKQVGGLVSSLKPVKRASLFELKESQKDALNVIEKNNLPVLLWGETGSGKTEIYRHFIAKHLKQSPESQVLVLIPEIMLTPQTIQRFQEIFGNTVGVWHSKLTKKQKAQEWHRIQNQETKVLVGTRSAVLLPFQHLGAVVMDEEHEWTYKNDFAPRYWAHDVLDFWFKKYQTKIVLGTATPKFETLHHFKKHGYEVHRLKEKVFQPPKTKVEVVDLKTLQAFKNYTPLSNTLQEKIQVTLEKGRQVILFLNKRGYSASALCQKCGTVFECKRCDTALKFHKGNQGGRFICHFCGTIYPVPSKCYSCDSVNYRFLGWGTQQVESTLRLLFPEAKVTRADRDTIKNKQDYENLWSEFAAGNGDILIGTQMISKGLDFEKVDLVGVIQADIGLNLPDFRSEERVFQLLYQVIGRTGRRQNTGEVVLQTFDPDNQLFHWLANQDIDAFYQHVENDRKTHLFPPFSALAKMRINGRNKAQAFLEGKALFERIERTIKEKSLPVQTYFTPAFFPKINHQYYFHIILQAETKNMIHEALSNIEEIERYKIDFQPASIL